MSEVTTTNTWPAEAEGAADADLEALELDFEFGAVYPFECTRAELFSGAVRVGDDLDPSSIIEHATRYTSIGVESAAGGRSVDIWRTDDLAVIHDGTNRGVVSGVVVPQGRLEFQVASYVQATLGELADRPAASAGTDEVFDGTVLMIGSGSPGNEGPKTVVVKAPTGTYAGISAAGSSDVEIGPVSAVTAWAMIVEALRS